MPRSSNGGLRWALAAWLLTCACGDPEVAPPSPPSSSIVPPSTTGPASPSASTEVEPARADPAPRETLATRALRATPVTGTLEAVRPIRGRARGATSDGLDVAITLAGATSTLHLTSTALDHDGGLAVRARSTSVGTGAIVIVDHNLDAVVDPPRFLRSRWSDVYWVPPTFASGSPLALVPIDGVQYFEGFTNEDGSACLSDANGPVVRLVERDGLLMRTETVGCPPRVAEQRELVFHRIGVTGIIVADDAHGGDEYLSIEHTLPLAERVFLVHAAWRDGGSYDEGAETGAARSTRGVRTTRLVVIDGDGHLHWWYLDVSAHCEARTAAVSGSSVSFRCGSVEFRLDDLELTRLPS